MNKEIVSDFDDIIKYLNLALYNLEIKRKKIDLEIKKWKFKITVSELKNSLDLILKYVLKWYTNYKKTKDILCIDLKEYDIVSKESSYILGETCLIDDIYSEIIDFTIGKIGASIRDELNKGRNSNE